MKILSITNAVIELPDQTQKGEDPPKAPSHQRVLVLGWRCDTCKCVQSHKLAAKQAYSEQDVLAVARAAFNLSFFDCGCTDGEKDEPTTA